MSGATGPMVIGRYALFDELASGGMATVHLGRTLGPDGETVAIKRLHARLLKDREFVAMFMDEARIVSRIPRHPNVVPMIDLVRRDDGIFLVIESVHGEVLASLTRDAYAQSEPIPPKIVATIVCGVLSGLHAAHETKSRGGDLLGIVHRDVSPHNIMVGADGVARILDFGVREGRDSGVRGRRRGGAQLTECPIIRNCAGTGNADRGGNADQGGRVAESIGGAATAGS